MHVGVNDLLNDEIQGTVPNRLDNLNKLVQNVNWLELQGI